MMLTACEQKPTTIDVKNNLVGEIVASDEQIAVLCMEFRAYFSNAAEFVFEHGSLDKLLDSANKLLGLSWDSTVYSPRWGSGGMQCAARVIWKAVENLVKARKIDVDSFAANEVKVSCSLNRRADEVDTKNYTLEQRAALVDCLQVLVTGLQSQNAFELSEYRSNPDEQKRIRDNTRKAVFNLNAALGVKHDNPKIYSIEHAIHTSQEIILKCAA